MSKSVSFAPVWAAVSKPDGTVLGPCPGEKPFFSLLDEGLLDE
ncbi:hypothetical protein [Candidatus Methylacidiphilum infernorum]|nr:hypothetical protein [Candidatus Methylacidiphilum infernorum]